ncbi:MAG: DUF3482 domain-containing protein [Burkholderiaceae bacterium]
MEISISLVSHTNAGKTTLARTLLGKEVGIVRDESHVTEVAESHEMVRSAEGDVLTLWDTPGFGDSMRLAKRLAKSDSPLNWMVEQVWDRLRDRPLYSSQQALRNVKEHADLVLYLVNASEDPDGAGYVAPEMSILTWTGKPVVALLNQMGPPRTREQEQQEVDQWRERFAEYDAVKEVMALDAFARCWVQERVLLGALTPLLPNDKRASYDRLFQTWLGQRERVFDQSIQVLTEGVARAALDVEDLPDAGLAGRVRDLGANLGIGRKDENSSRDHAMVEMARRWDLRERADTDALISLHELSGSAAAEVMTRVDAHYAISEKLSEGKAAVVGGVATGALAGLKADIATGGFTLGGGMIAGSVLGALGAAGLARGYNLVRGQNQVVIQWSDQVLINKLVNAVLTYLAVTHFGRGRGDWERAEYPEHWFDITKRCVQDRRSAFVATWKSRGVKTDLSEASLSGALNPLFRSTVLVVLNELYPAAFDAADAADPDSTSAKSAAPNTLTP